MYGTVTVQESYSRALEQVTLDWFVLLVRSSVRSFDAIKLRRLRSSQNGDTLRYFRCLVTLGLSLLLIFGLFLLANVVFHTAC